MTRLLTRPRAIPGWFRGIMEDVEADLLPLGALDGGENFVPQPNGDLPTRGGSRAILSLLDDAGTPAALSVVQILRPFTPTGAIVIGWSNGQNKHYAWRLTTDLAFTTGTESTSRHDLTAAPSTAWNNTTTPARPVLAELFEKAFLVDATVAYASRNTLLSIDSAGTILQPAFAFGAGAAQAIRPYCAEEYNNVLFIAGYGTEDASDADRPEMVRHSFLGRSPDATGAGVEGFDVDAWALFGAKGQRVTALRKGRGIILAAKEHELYRVSGFGRAYPGWQYQIDQAQNTLGFGVVNPYALEFADPWWFGIGRQGPFRTDGYNIESLRGPRQRGWRGIDALDKAWIGYHPERRIIVFGVHETEAAGDDYPNVLWTWDMDRDTWAPDWRPSTTMFSGGAITTATAVAPAAAPTIGAETGVTTSGYTGNWTVGDAAAQTEFWEKEGAGGTYSLIDTLGATVATLARTGRKDATAYTYKVRHKKAGVFSEFSAEQEVPTTVAAPSLEVGAADTQQVWVLVTNLSVQTVDDLVIERSPAGAGTWSTVQTTAALGPGVREVWYDETAVSGTAYDYRAKAELSGHPDSAYSATDTATAGDPWEPIP